MLVYRACPLVTVQFFSDVESLGVDDFDVLGIGFNIESGSSL